MAYKKLILRLINISIIFVSLLKIKMIIGYYENLMVLKILILKNFQYTVNLDS